MQSWADQFNTYDEACEYYGADTPAQVAQEEKWRNLEDGIEEMDAMEARGGPNPSWFHADPECPF